ncbi:MAG: VOC family protein [Spirochaetales bacterium]|nr:VOC family protein [Spirochaetales bacterium]
MANVSTYLNFKDNTEEVFNFYKAVFKGEWVGEISRFRDMPANENMPPLPEDAKDLVMHMALKITGGHILRGSDSPEFMGHTIVPGNNITINIEPDSREEADRLFSGLSAEGKVIMPLADSFWGAYFGMFTDKYGVNWMINYEESGEKFHV